MRSYRIALLIAAAIALWWTIGPTSNSRNANTSRLLAAPSGDAMAKLRRPIALALVDQGRLLFAANRRSGSISVIDTEKRRVVGEFAVGETLADLAATSDGRHLLVVDEAAHALLLFSRRGETLTRVGQLLVSPYPVSVRISADGSRCFVASLWSRRLTIVDLTLPDDVAKKTQMTVHRTIELPFAPRVQLLVKDDSKLIVADSFGGRLAIIDVHQGKLEAVRELPAHNIRGMALSPDGTKLLVSHQILNDLAETTQNDVHWGVLMSNVLRWVVLDRLLLGKDHILKDSHVHMTGDTQSAGGDPAAVTITRDGRAVIALAGVAEVGFGRERDYSLKRRAVGMRPTAVIASPEGRRAYVANAFSDSISVLNLVAAKVEGEIPLGPPAKLTLADRGEILFYNARLSLDGWMSCHSCHTDGHTNGLLNDNLGDDSFGSPKRVLSLLGVSDTSPWAWNGKVQRIEFQIRKSIQSTMQGRKPNEADVRALAAYLKTLAPPPPLAKLRDVDLAAITRGRKLFTQHKCNACHRPPTYTSIGSYDVGLSDQLGNRKFNPPSLRGVSQRGPYFHDNRAATLEDVLEKYRHRLQGELTEEHLNDLASFLRSL